jgi:L-threonylcarbamoyladenylate synthase
MEDMKGRIAAVLEGGDSDVGVESTVLDLCHQPPRLLRPGGVTPAMLEEIIGPIDIDPAVVHALREGAVAASPGMKYKHYAPKASIRLVKGTPEAYAAYVNAHNTPGTVALCFHEDANNLNAPTVTYGHRYDPLEQAHRLFDALRQLDEQGAVTVYAACPAPTGVGLAVYNRLIRAAGFQVINTIAVVGLTGPTGAGKTTVANAWRRLGVPIIDTDILARQVVEPGSPCLAQLAKAFTSAILNADGSLNRAELARRAFANEEGRAKLNAITHPAIMDLANNLLEEAADNGHPAAVVDAPLLFEAGMDTICTHVVAVLSPAEQRLARIMARDNIDEDAARQRMSAQQADNFYARDGVTVLQNCGTEDELIEKAITLWRELERRWSSP